MIDTTERERGRTLKQVNPEVKRSTYIQTVFDKNVIYAFPMLIIVYAWPASETTIQKNVKGNTYEQMGLKTANKKRKKEPL